LYRLPIEVVYAEIVIVPNTVRNRSAKLRTEKRHVGIVNREKCDSSLATEIDRTTENTGSHGGNTHRENDCAPKILLWSFSV
jgi:hypothetical protein